MRRGMRLHDPARGRRACGSRLVKPQASRTGSGSALRRAATEAGRLLTNPARELRRNG